MRQHALRALESAFRRVRVAERTLGDAAGEWAKVKAHIVTAALAIDAALRHVNERIPKREPKRKSLQLTGKQKAVLAAVQLGACSLPTIVRATGITNADASNAVRLLRDRGLLVQPETKGQHNAIRVPQATALDAWNNHRRAHENAG